MAIISSTTEPKTRGSFMSFNSSVQQISSGIAASIAGALVTRNELGQLEHYNWVGYIALVAGVLAILAAGRVKALS
jgi:predicted MFS family arabinose efflux permease